MSGGHSDSQPRELSGTCHSGHEHLKDLRIALLAVQVQVFSPVGCGLRAIRLNVILAYEFYQKAVEKQPEQVGVIHTPPKQILLLVPHKR